ncbi:MAG: hypothetical protein VKI81_04755 [Synechococcaceae cyanobacterium]|nr:hypothetical protein [Synechococcaceae cyanobacterium]
MNTPEDSRAAIGSVLVLNALQPVIGPLLASIEGWRGVLPSDQWQRYRSVAEASARRVEREVALCGSCLVYRGPLEAARSIEACLRTAGLTTSLNVEMAGSAATGSPGGSGCSWLRSAPPTGAS